MAMGTTNIGIAPKMFHWKEAIVFFVIFIALANFLGLGLFIGVLCNHFRQQSTGHSSLMTDEQMAWIEAQKNVLFSTAKVVPRAPANWLRKKCYKLTRHKAFGTFIMLLILSSVALMSIEHYGMTDEFKRDVEIANRGE